MMARFLLLAISIIGSSLPAAAHPGNSPANDFLTGLTHPLSGIDHLVPMIALGIWAAIMRGRSLWLLPMAFLSAMAMGASFGQMNMSLPLTEPVILASAVVLSVLAVLRLRFHQTVAVALTSVFAIAHGHAHAMELPAQVSFQLYGIGFISATAALHMSGILIAYLTSNTEVRAPRTTS
jgi:urease accessory protein